MPDLFERIELKGIPIRNRLVRSATYEGMANSDGTAKDMLVDLTSDLAKGEVGLIISSHAFVEPRGRVRPPQLGVHSDEMVPGLARLARAAHEDGASTILQLAHGGCTAAEPAGQLVGPSAIALPDGRVCAELDENDIEFIVESFKRGAERALQAGFDGVQIHSAHGYLLSQFLSPYFNRRSDRYGGSLVNRARVHVEILNAIRGAVGSNVPVVIKMNSDDFLDGGFTRHEMVEVARMLEAEGIDAVEMSGGTGLSPANRGFARPGVQSPDEEVYYLDAAKMYKDAVSVPLMLVGGILSHEVASDLVDKGIADFVALSRPLVREPYLVKRWREGDTSRAACVHCNQCFGPARSGEGIYCVYASQQEGV